MPDLLAPPPRLDLPMFTYGPDKPDQPAYEQLAGYVVHTEVATTVGGGLRVRDGLPLFDPDGTVGVRGVLLTFAVGREKDAYTAICSVAPRQHYRWDMTEMRVDGRPGRVNLLRGRHPDRGSSDEWFTTWSAGDDPLLRFGLCTVRRAAVDHATAPFPTTGVDETGMWDRFYGLQSAYLLLWSAVERFTALTFGPAQPALDRTWRLGDDPEFRECVVAAGVAPSAKTADSRDPTRARRIREDGAGAMFSWDAARHLVAHPGRTAFADGVVVRRALIDLHDAFRLLLSRRLPALAGTWRAVDPAGEADGWLLRPVVASEALS